jgi:hypothetical protein
VNIVYVDMSAKTEHWTLASAVAMSNDLAWVCLVSGKVKQRARKLLAERFGSKNLHYRLFAAMIYLTLQGRLSVIEQVVIDRDYHGGRAEATIKNLLLAHIRKERPEAGVGLICFANIKGTDADRLAKEVYDGKAKADRVVGYGELSRLLKA